MKGSDLGSPQPGWVGTVPWAFLRLFQSGILPNTMAINSAAKTRLRVCSLFTWAHCLRWPGDGGPLSPQRGLGGAWAEHPEKVQPELSGLQTLSRQDLWLIRGLLLDVVREGDDPVRTSQRIKPQPEKDAGQGVPSRKVGRTRSL